MSGLLSGRVALITAAGSGMGRAGAELFASEGATVVVVDLDLGAAESTVASIEQAGGKALAMQCDVADVGQLRTVFDRVERELGVLHVLYNHAGIPGPAGLEEVEEAEWHHAIDVNIKSAWFGTALGLPLLRKAGGKGSIIYTASVSGIVGSTMSPLYSMAKGGVVNFARGVALRARTRGDSRERDLPGTDRHADAAPVLRAHPGAGGARHGEHGELHAGRGPTRTCGPAEGDRAARRCSSPLTSRAT